VTLPQNATLQSLSIDITGAAGSLRLGVYDATGTNGARKNLKMQTSAFADTVGWNTIPVTPLPMAAGNYWLTFLPAADNGNLSNPKAYGSGSCVWSNNVVGQMPLTAPAASGTDACHWAFYATFSVP